MTTQNSESETAPAVDLHSVVRTLRWRVEEFWLAVILALMIAPWCWQFSAGIVFSEIAGVLDFWLGRSSSATADPKP